MTAADRNVTERMESRFYGIALPIKAIAFIPSLATLVAFVALIVIYGRVKPTKANPYVGRLEKIHRSKLSKSGVSMFTIVKMKLLRRPRTQEGEGVEELDGKYKRSTGDEPLEYTNKSNTITI